MKLKPSGGVRISPLKAHVGFWLRLVSNHVSHSFARKLENSGVTVAEWVILREIYEGPDVTSPGEIVKTTGLTKGAVSKLIERLHSKKFVRRDVSSADRRAQTLELTSAGLELIPRLAALADENDEEFFSTLTRKERADLIEIMQKLATANQLKTFPTE